MYKVCLATYANERFEKLRQELNLSAKRFGIERQFSFTDKDLHASSYYLENKSLLDEICGAGYWAWKPYIILQALKSLDEGDVLIYADAGSLLIESPIPLVEIVRKRPDGLMIFDARPLTNVQFTKRDCFVELGCDYPKIWYSYTCIATVIVVRKCPRSMAFISEWKDYCQDRTAITDDASKSGKPELSGFLQHRHDQAILSVLVARDCIETYRNPTQWGNYLKLPKFRINGEHVSSPFGISPPVRTYSWKPQRNSPYGTIFEINRSPNMVGKRPLPKSAFTVHWYDMISLDSLFWFATRLKKKLSKS